MRTVKAWAIVQDGKILTVADMPRTFMRRSDAADEAWKFKIGSIVRVEIREVKRKKVKHG